MLPMRGELTICKPCPCNEINQIISWAWRGVANQPHTPSYSLILPIGIIPPSPPSSPRNWLLRRNERKNAPILAEIPVVQAEPTAEIQFFSSSGSTRPSLLLRDVSPRSGFSTKGYAHRPLHSFDSSSRALGLFSRIEG